MPKTATFTRDTWRDEVRKFCAAQERSIHWVGSKAGLEPTSGHFGRCVSGRNTPSDALLHEVARVIGMVYKP